MSHRLARDNYNNPKVIFSISQKESSWELSDSEHILATSLEEKVLNYRIQFFPEAE